MHILQAVLRRSHLVAFALSCIMRASDPAHVPAHPLSSERLHLLCKNAPNPPLAKLKSAIVHYILLKRCPHVVLGGTAFCRHGILSAQRDKALFSRILSITPDIDPCAPSQTAVFAAISGFPACIVSFPVCERVSKNRRRFRALSAFEKSSLTSAHIRRPFLASFAAFDPRFQSSSATLRARVVPLGSPPHKPPSTF